MTEKQVDKIMTGFNTHGAMLYDEGVRGTIWRAKTYIGFSVVTWILCIAGILWFWEYDLGNMDRTSRELLTFLKYVGLLGGVVITLAIGSEIIDGIGRIKFPNFSTLRNLL